MEDPKVPFADTTARRAQLMAATERFKTSITDSVDSIKGDANEIGKTAAFVGGAALAVYLVVNAILPKSAEYRYAEKYGGLIGGLLTSILTNVARQQLSGFLSRIRQNNAINPTADPDQTKYHEKAPTQPVDYTA